MVLARGRFGKEFRCIVPEVTSDFSIRLLEARHPLLEATLSKQNRAVVPFTIEMGTDKKALIVTGPNTGGKTVFLKTVGLLSMMTHCAIPVPAAEGSALPLISSIEVDIGDQQSISESLSTFSSHMSNIRRILQNVQERSLVLLDELGTGTDPEEGAPLAVAILQHLLESNIKTLITSHHSLMKMFAFNDPSCLTAAMEFDEANLLPAYKIHVDQVGASHAFDIAERLGLPAGLLKNARSLMGEDRRRIEEFQRRLQEKIASLTKRQEELELEKAQWEARAHEQQHKLDALQSKLEQQLRALREQNTDLIRTINAKVETLLENIRDTAERQKLRKQYKQEVVPSISQLQELTATEQKEETFAPGERVWVNLYKDFGQVVSIKKGQAEVLIRNIRFSVPVSTLEKKVAVQETLPKGVEVHFEEKNVEPELNLIGQTVDEALVNADKYLDDAVLGQLPQVRLIHGHGTGRLKRALEEMLSSHPHVRGYHPETPQRGGTGVTVVELKQL
jgi:DNA mismatch repair protein MutS2